MARSGINKMFWAKQKLFVVYDAPENLSYKETKPSIGKKLTVPVELVNSVNRTSYELDELKK